MAREDLQVREVSKVEGNRLVRIVRRSSSSVVTWRRAQMVLLSVQGLDVAGIAKVTFTNADRVREVINNFGRLRYSNKETVFHHWCRNITRHLFCFTFTSTDLRMEK
jgi:hypothetical protein